MCVSPFLLKHCYSLTYFEEESKKLSHLFLFNFTTVSCFDWKDSYCAIVLFVLSLQVQSVFCIWTKNTCLWGYDTVCVCVWVCVGVCECVWVYVASKTLEIHNETMRHSIKYQLPCSRILLLAQRGLILSHTFRVSHGHQEFQDDPRKKTKETKKQRKRRWT